MSRGDAPREVREVLQAADVRRVSLRDAHGHAIVEVPVEPETIGMVLEPIVQATKAIADTIGEVTLYVEKAEELPPPGGTVPRTAEERRAEARREATGAELTDGVVPGEAERAAPGNVTQQDIERIREANAVPEGSERSVRRTAPEQGGEPELKDTGEWPDVRQR